jgi:hypothetical protein
MREFLCSAGNVDDIITLRLGPVSNEAVVELAKRAPRDRLSVFVGISSPMV